MINEPVQDFILQTADNMRIAAAVSEQWPELKSRIAGAFLDRLKERLSPELPGWKFEKWKTFFADPWACFYLYKQLWLNQYYVTLQAHQLGTVLYVGVQRDKARIEGRPHDERLSDAMKSIHPSAKANLWWEAFVALRSPAADWSTPDVLWRMHQDVSFLDDVATQLLEIAKLVEPLIDEMAEKGQGEMPAPR